MGCTNTNHTTVTGIAETPAPAVLTVAPLGCPTADLFAESPRAGAAR